MEDRINKAKESIAGQLDLPRDVVLNIPKISITGDNEITIENHQGIVLFDDDQIKINSKVGQISLYGRGFEILYIGGSTLTISGRFRSVHYEGDE
jgi:sporulation protein YqfC